MSGRNLASLRNWWNIGSIVIWLRCSKHVNWMLRNKGQIYFAPITDCFTCISSYFINFEETYILGRHCWTPPIINWESFSHKINCNTCSTDPWEFRMQNYRAIFLWVVHSWRGIVGGKKFLKPSILKGKFPCFILYWVELQSKAICWPMFPELVWMWL